MSRDDLRYTIAPYDGSGDVNLWFKKVRLVARLRKIRDLADFVPLYLDGQAFSVYDEMNEGDKADVDKIEDTLRAAFEVDRYTAFDKLLSRRWIHGEPADTYLADLRRLAKLAKIEDEEVVRNAFVVGLPPDVSQQLRGSARTSSCKMSALCEQARILLRQKVQLHDDTAAAAFSQRVQQVPSAKKGHKDGALGERRCFICGGEHLARSCARRADRRGITCWRCGETGHVAKTCPASDSGNGTREGPNVA